MTNEFTEILGTVASAMLGSTSSKEKDTATVVAPPVLSFGPEAAVVEGAFEEVATEATVEENKSENKKGKLTMKQSIAKIKGFLFKQETAGTTTVEATVDGTTATTVPKEGFFAKAKAFTKGFVEGFVSFTKDHVIKSFVGLGFLTLAGTFTTGMASAVLVGGALYAASSFAYSYIVSKYKKEDFSVVSSAIDAVGGSVVYGFFGAIGAFYLAQVAMFAAYYAFVYGYVAISYIGYFIVA